jgi:ribonuclease HI
MKCEEEIEILKLRVSALERVITPPDDILSDGEVEHDDLIYVYNDNDIFVDGFSSGNPGIGGFIVAKYDGTVLFRKDYGNVHSNNWYELAAIATAVIKYPGRHIWSDSVTAIAWANGRVSKDVAKLYSNDQAFSLMIETIRKVNPVISKWNTRKWGEIPADPGNK